MMPRALANVRKAFPNLLIDCDILKIEDAVDYLLLGKGELVALSSRIEHPMLTCAPLARGQPNASCRRITRSPDDTEVPAAEIAQYPLIGVDPNDPYGRIMADLFARHSLNYEVTIRARFGSTVCALVTQGLRCGDRR